MDEPTIEINTGYHGQPDTITINVNGISVRIEWPYGHDATDAYVQWTCGEGWKQIKQNG